MPETTAAAFSISGVTFTYRGSPIPAIRDLSLEIGPRQFTALIGPNGAGKSTLVRLLAGLSPPDCGTIQCLGVELGDWNRARLARRVAVVAQEPASVVALSVQEYVALGRNPYVGPWSALGASDHEVVEAALARTDLSDLRGRQLAELSGGERQRTRLARALAQEPEILVLDEPTAFLDFRHALWTFQTLEDLVTHHEMTVVCVTHDMNLASRHATRLVLVGDGRLLAVGDPGSVLSRATLAEAYGCEVAIEHRPGLGHCVLPVRALTKPAGGA